MKKPQLKKKTKRQKVVQVYTPKTKRWVKIDMATGTHQVTHKKTEGAYKNIPKGKGEYYEIDMSEK